MDKIRILVVASDNIGGVGFYRSRQPHEQLLKQYPDDFVIDYNMHVNWDDEEYLRKYDIIHFHKGLYNNMDTFRKGLRFCKDNGIVTIMDIDDHWELDRTHPAYITHKNNGYGRIVRDNFSLVDYVTTTTPLFAEQIKPYNKNVMVFNNCINPTDGRFVVVKPKSDRLRVGFIMGSSHENDMKLIGSVMSKFSKEELEKLQFVMCGFDTNGTVTEYNPQTKEQRTRPIRPEESVWCRYEEMVTDNYKLVSPEYERFLKQYIPQSQYPNVKDECYMRCWTKNIDHYYEHYSNVDVLLVPLAVTNFNKVKSPLKVAECVFSHTAIVASNFGPYTLDLKNAVLKGGDIDPTGNAILIDSDKPQTTWYKMVKRLLNNPDLVRQLQDNLYNDLHEKFDIRNETVKRCEFYKELVKNKKG